jgi:anti-sigma regulatory factor (Ser/Thr protein kinase)
MTSTNHVTFMESHSKGFPSMIKHKSTNIILSELCTNILSHVYKEDKITDSSTCKLITKMKMYSMKYCHWLIGAI